MAPTLLALSGPSSSGKTTIARHLLTIFPSTLLLHEDDFYLPEAQLPLRAGFKDWDCAAALDIPALLRALTHIKTHGTLPEWLESKEAGNAVGEDGVRPETVERLKKRVGAWLEGRKEQGMGEQKVVVVDGFLLVGESVKEVREAMDIKILLRASYEKAKARREARSGYVTLEGFWEDPEGYVDSVVWPGFVEEHGFLFEGGDVEGRVDESVVRRLRVKVCPSGEWGMEEALEWVVKSVMGEIDGKGGWGAEGRLHED